MKCSVMHFLCACDWYLSHVHRYSLQTHLTYHIAVATLCHIREVCIGNCQVAALHCTQWKDMCVHDIQLPHLERQWSRRAEGRMGRAATNEWIEVSCESSSSSDRKNVDKTCFVIIIVIMAIYSIRIFTLLSRNDCHFVSIFRWNVVVVAVLFVLKTIENAHLIML